MSRLLLLALLLLPLGSQAQQAIYRTTDAQGNVVFTDTPPSDGTPADQVKLRPTNTVRPVEVPPPTAPADSSDAEAVSYSVTITDPPNETSFPMGPGNFPVSATVSPALGEENLQLFIDGTPQGQPQQDTTWDLTNVFRGRHDLTVGVIDASGETVALSDPVTVFVHRPSTNFKNRQPPPKPPKPQPKPQPK